MKTARTLFKATGLFLGLLVVLAAGYLVAAAIGAMLPRVATSTTSLATTAGQVSTVERPVTVYLLSSLLHTDIAVPVSANLIARFPGLAGTRLPFDNPQMK